MSEHERDDALLMSEVRELFELMKSSDIAEVLIERGDAKVHIKRTSAQPAPAIMPMYSQPQQVVSAVAPPPAVITASAQSVDSSSAEAAAETATSITITAPMVGTFYASPSPKEPPYVQVGDEVRPGDVLGIIEAMKIMNEIECEVHGRVTQVLVQSGEPVEYGKGLMIIEPL